MGRSLTEREQFVCLAFWLEDKDCGSLGLAGTSEGFLGNKCTQGDSGLRVSHGHLRGDRARLKGTLGVAHNSVNGDQSHGIMTVSPAG